MSVGRFACGVLGLALLAGACDSGGGGGDGLSGFGGGTAIPVTPLGDVAQSTPEGGLLPPNRRLALTHGQVLDRPWPERVTPDKAWPATVRGAGERIEVTPAERNAGDRDRGRIVDGFKLASFQFPFTGSAAPSTTSTTSDRTALLLPNGARWYPTGPFTVDRGGDLPFSWLTAELETVQVVVSKPFAELVTADGQVTARGPFEGPDGRKVDQLVLPRGTKAVPTCAPDRPACGTEDQKPLVTVIAVSNTAVVVDTTLDTEAAVAGTAEGIALGRTWTGLVAAVQGKGMKAVALHGEHGWSMVAGTTSALQLWIDVWPVADTTLSASVGADSCGENRQCSIRVRWTNTGHASSQMYIAEGTGPGAHEVSFDLNESLGHDAGLRIGRGDRVLNLDGGADIDSNLAPGGKVDRGVTHGAESATITLRGNFPDVRLNLG